MVIELVHTITSDAQLFAKMGQKTMPPSCRPSDSQRVYWQSQNEKESLAVAGLREFDDGQDGWDE